MNEEMNESPRLSRRGVLTGTALVLGAAASVLALPRAAAQQKLSQADAQYQKTPKDGKHCGACANFKPPNACQFVEGAIGSNGWCQLFAPKT